MKDSELKQGSKEWLAWRQRGLGASDAPAVMGESPWTTLFELYCQKTGLLPQAEPHPYAAAAMRRGVELEPIARALYIERTGIEVAPETFTHAEFPYIRASLDGWNAEKRHVLELKAPGVADLKTARKGQIPKKYKWQLVHQYLCTDALSMSYATFDGKDELIIIPFERDLAAEAELLTALQAFWQLILTATPPPVGPKDLDKLVNRMSGELEKFQKTVHALEILSGVMRSQDHG